MDDLAQKAIAAAISANWREAISLNKEIIAETPNDVDALNRLARAHAECGQVKTAKSIAQRVLKIDPSNTIAAKAVKKWKGLKSGTVLTSSPTAPDAFLEEPGKTKIVSLLCLGDKALIAKLDTADPVILAPRGHRVSVTTQDGRYIGRLPDDLAARLKNLIHSDYEYQVLTKSITPKEVKIFIREVKRSKKLKNTSSFPAEKIDYISYTPPELVTEKETQSYFPDTEEVE